MRIADIPFHIVLHQPEIPDNTGAVGRTCVALGAKLWLVRPLGFQISDRRIRRAGLDYWQHLDWEAVDGWDDLVARLSGHTFWYLSKTAKKTYTDVTFARGDALVFGSETQGLPLSMLQTHADHALRVPIHANARSLNLSVTVGIVAFEARRQLNLHS